MNGQICESNFILIKQLGSGAFGEVYQVYDDELGKHTALKIARAYQLSGLDMEIEVIKRLTELGIPNTTKFYREGYCSLLHNKKFYEMSLQDASLYDYIKMKNTLNPKQLRDIMFELFYTMYKFRENDFKHRDISVYNILYSIDKTSRTYILPDGQVRKINTLIRPIYSDYNTSVFEKLDQDNIEDYSDMMALLQLWIELINITPELTDNELNQIQNLIDFVTDNDDLSASFLETIIQHPYFD